MNLNEDLHPLICVGIWYLNQHSQRLQAWWSRPLLIRNASTYWEKEIYPSGYTPKEGRWNTRKLIIIKTCITWYRVLGAGALGWPRGMGWGGRWVQDGEHMYTHGGFKSMVWQNQHKKKKNKTCITEGKPKTGERPPCLLSASQISSFYPDVPKDPLLPSLPAVLSGVSSLTCRLSPEFPGHLACSISEGMRLLVLSRHT